MRALLLVLLLTACGTANRCVLDSDCKLVEDYCACACRGAPLAEPAPTCPNPCATLVPLCEGKSGAACSGGACVPR